MSIRTRKLIGTIALLVLVITWGLLAMALAQSVLTDINGFVAAIYYVVAGLGWVLPAMPLISWMAAPTALFSIRPFSTKYLSCANLRHVANLPCPPA